MKIFKKLWKVIAVTMVLVMLGTTTALACSYNAGVQVNESKCETIDVSGYAYASDRGVKIRAELYVDGVLKDFKERTTGSSYSSKFAKVSFSSNASVGDHPVEVIAYRWQKVGSHQEFDKWGNWHYGYDSNADENSCGWLGCWHRNKIYKTVNDYDWVRKDSQSKTATVEDCYNVCDETIKGEKVYGDLYNVGDPVWGEWINPLNGKSYRHGVQYIASDWTRTWVDARDGETVCKVKEGTTDGEVELYEEKCSPRWTGRYAQTYIRTVRGNWITYLNLLVPAEADTNGDGKVDAKEAKAWEWSPEYLALKGTLECETQQWKGKLVDTYKEFKDICGVVHEKGTFFGGNHYDSSCEIFDFCAWKESTVEQ